MRVAITGASGFIGSHVLKELTGCGAQVVAVTRDPSRLQERVAGVRVVEMDLAAPGAQIFARLGEPDVLIHLAWEGLPNYKSLHHFESELPRQYSFLSKLVAEGLPAMFVAGTCSEYGMRQGQLFEEMPTAPVHSYGFAKDALRRQLEFLKSTRPFRLTWGRLFYTYGQGQSSNSLYPALTRAVLDGKGSFDMSAGEQLRDFLPVGEVARRIVRAALAGLDLGIVNICNGEPVSVRGIVEQWLKEKGWQMTLNLGRFPYPDYEPMAFWGSRRRWDSLLERS